MRKALWVLLAALFVCTEASAADWAFPIKLGDTAASVKEKLGEPEEKAPWGIDRAQERLFYKRLGVEVRIDVETGTVDMMTFHGKRRLPDWSKHEGEIVEGIDMDSTLEDAVRVLGPDYELYPEEEGGAFRNYSWKAGDRDYYDVEFWEADYTNENGSSKKGDMYFFKAIRYFKK